MLEDCSNPLIGLMKYVASEGIYQHVLLILFAAKYSPDFSQLPL